MQIKVQDLEPGMVVYVKERGDYFTVEDKIELESFPPQYKISFEELSTLKQYPTDFVFILKPSSPEKDESLYNYPGFTRIWSGTGAKDLFSNAIRRGWAELHLFHEDAFQLIETEPEHFVMLVANEFIDWAHYRRTGEFIPCRGQQPIDPMRYFKSSQK